ncbi:MAG: ABC transporter substrate-binding protein [Chloroflexota bacterium]
MAEQSRTQSPRLTRRALLQAAVLGGAGALLAACAAPAAQPTQAPKPAATDAPKAAGTAAATQAPATKAAGKTSLEMWTFAAGANLEILKKMVGEFGQKNTDVEIKVTPVGTGEIQAKFITAVAGGAPPDIFNSTMWTPPDLSYNGVLAPLDEIKLPVKLLSNFDPITIYGGKRYGIPMNGGMGAMGYNKDLMDAAGIAKPPATWDELVQFGQKVTKGDGTWGIALPNKAEATTTNVVWSFLQTAGAEMLTPDGKAPAFNSAEGLAAFQFAADLVQKHKVGAQKSYALVDSLNDFGTGKIGAINLYPVWVGNLKGFKHKSVTAEMPKQKGPGSHFSGSYWTMPTLQAKGAKFEAFGRFVSWWSTPDVNARWARDTGGLPTSQDAVNSDVFKKFVEGEPLVKAFIDSLPYARPFPGVLGTAAVLQILAEAWEAAVLGKTAPKEALNQAEKRAADELKKAQTR